MRKVAIVQARMGSTRLPGKVLKPLAGRPVLEHVVTRVRVASALDGVVVATSVEAADDPIQGFCERHDWPCFRGSEHDVLSRYQEAATGTGADIIVRVTSDCPLFSPQILDAMLVRFDPARLDYLSTNLPRRSFPVGLDCEIMRRQALDRASREATTAYDREHVTPYIYNNPELFRLEGFACETDLQHLRVTLDTPEDYVRLVDLVRAHPEATDPACDVLGIICRYFGQA